MYEELIRNLTYTIEKHKNDFTGFGQTVIADMATDCKRAIEALTAENAAKNAEIERLESALFYAQTQRDELKDYCDGLSYSHQSLSADLARVTAERDAALQCIHNIDDAISRGKLVFGQWSGQREAD